MFHGKQKAPPGPLELIDGRRARQRLEEADRIISGPPQQALVVEAVPGLVGQPEQLPDQGGLAGLPGTPEDNQAERSKQLADLPCSVPVHHQDSLTGKTPIIWLAKR